MIVHLNLCLFSYRAAKQASTKYSPFHMMFGREPISPIDLEVLPPVEIIKDCEDITEKDVTDAMVSLHSFHEEIYSKASANISESQTKQKDYYDSRHEMQTFSVGEKVLVENTRQKQRKGGKLADKWLGPYRINREISKGVYGLENIDGKLMKQSCNTSRLKRYYEDVTTTSIKPVDDSPTESCEVAKSTLLNENEIGSAISSMLLVIINSRN